MRWPTPVLCAVVAATPFSASLASHTPNPTSVTIAGSFQSELGCSDDWKPDCALTHLKFDPDDDVWQGSFDLPAGTWEYKAALNDSWTESYGRNGGNITLTLAAPATVKFYYDHKTHWITSNRNAVIATAPGSYQAVLGCPGDWQPDCLRSLLEDPDGDGIYKFTAAIPAGKYEVKVAINESWSENYGAGGAPNGSNIPFTVATDCQATEFTYDSVSHVLTIAPATAPAQPATVTIAGSLQSELGCAGDWDPACAATHLAFDATDGVWQGTFSVPAGNWEYKAALNGTWDENYGANATRGGNNIPLNLAAASSVKFYYDHLTHWIADNKNKVIAVAPGSFQSELGCPGDWQPDCLRSWLQDPDGDGIYVFSTTALPAGNYETKVAINETWDENYGLNGVPGGANIGFTVPKSCSQMFFVYDSKTHVLTVSASGAPKGNLNKAQAQWITRDTIAWKIAPGTGGTVALHYSATGSLVLGKDGVSGGIDIPLTYDPAGLPPSLLTNYPQLTGYSAFKLPASADVAEALKSQLAVSAKDTAGELLDATSLQIPGGLDDLYTYDGPLGATFSGLAPTFRLWAPTARSVKLRLYNDSNPSTSGTLIGMAPDAPGVWKATGDASWYGKYYAYEVEVFVRSTGRVETNLVTDPYSVSLSRNSRRSHIVDLSSAALKPRGWDSQRKPSLDAPEDISLYELHVRDFSVNDTTVPAVQRGTFKAFTQLSSNGMRHLSALSFAGLTHVHVLPSFDIATINEDKSQWESPAIDPKAGPDSEQQQAAVTAVADKDGFNWGYDPWHYTVPEGSYSTNPDGSTRVVEFREMVQALGKVGLRTVMDVVYNHTSAAGQDDHSVLDRIVPGYYHRLNGNGAVENHSCCADTATERVMMAKLMTDTLLTWADQYKVDGFRFDVMSQIPKSAMVAALAAVNAVTVADGRGHTYFYGEGWDQGAEVDAAIAPAIQTALAGTGIGTFNDRLRDGARGGSPFDSGAAMVANQGFVNGLCYDPATSAGVNCSGDPSDVAFDKQNRISVGLAGNLASYAGVSNVAGVGYTGLPQENIAYVSVHDGETLFDISQYRHPLGTPFADAGRAQVVGLSLAVLAQGVPLVHAGDDLLRSKSGDSNSYNSGDYFNRVYWDGSANNWAVGLPPDNTGNNGANAATLGPILDRPLPSPASQQATILATSAAFADLLRVRRNTNLFRLTTAADINGCVSFPDQGAQVHGLIVERILGAGNGTCPLTSSGTNYRSVVVLFNASRTPQSFTIPAYAGKLKGTVSGNLYLHPAQIAGSDAVLQAGWDFTADATAGRFTVPARTTGVFVEYN